MELASDSFRVHLIYNCRYYISSATGELDSLAAGHLVEDLGDLDGALVDQANGRRCRPIAYNLDQAGPAVGPGYHSSHDDVASMKKDMLATFRDVVWPKLTDPSTRLHESPAGLQLNSGSSS
jgi:hypothetical protein